MKECRHQASRTVLVVVAGMTFLKDLCPFHPTTLLEETRGRDLIAGGRAVYFELATLAVFSLFRRLDRLADAFPR